MQKLTTAFADGVDRALDGSHPPVLRPTIALAQNSDGAERVELSREMFGRIFELALRQTGFDEAGYLLKNPDVAEALENFEIDSAVGHFARAGYFEQRPIAPPAKQVPWFAEEYPATALPIACVEAPREAVRLVIWDLDETFWKGTVTEGGIEQYIEENHQAVIELARRGIISSICSKNDKETILKILADKGILDYFVFPSIAWEPKGGRLAALVEGFQLRPATVMFIDDNPNNRAEAAAIVPDLQIEDEHFVQKILTDPRFKGKDDSKLTRLAQYRLMESRKRDEQSVGGDNEDFLRKCDVRVYIEYDVEPHIDRIYELINRTNQLNFTKWRLPENVEEAHGILRESFGFFARQAGLVRVVDKYGDYGFFGFFETETLRQEQTPGVSQRFLRHFCFSCRTLGMYVEQWLYEYLGQPELKIVGEVLTDLSAPRNIDWIRLVSSISDETASYEKVAPELRLYGGCEMHALGVYLKAFTDKIEVRGNYSANGMFIRINSADLALSAFERAPADFAEEAKSLGLPLDLSAFDYIGDASANAAFIFNFSYDAGGGLRYRHIRRGWEIALEPYMYPINPVDLTATSADELDRQLETMVNLNADQRDHVKRSAAHIRGTYELVMDDRRIEAVRSLLDRIPKGGKVIFLLEHDRLRHSDGEVRPAPGVTRYNSMIRTLVEEYPYVGLTAFSEAIENENEIHPMGHCERTVYLRMAQQIVAAVVATPPK